MNTKNTEICSNSNGWLVFLPFLVEFGEATVNVLIIACPKYKKSFRNSIFVT